MTGIARQLSWSPDELAPERPRSGLAVAVGVLPGLALFALFLAAYAWIRRDWVWIVGDDQNLMMPAINIGRGLVPNIDFVNGYPGLTFYVQRAIMLLVGELPISEHVYTALQAALFAVVAAWVLRRRVPAALIWLLVFFLWTVTYRLNPTPNPGNVMQSLAILSLYWMDRFATDHRIRSAAVAGGLAGLSFLFKQPGILLPVAFLLFSSYLAARWPARPLANRQRAAIALVNLLPLVGFAVVYLWASVFEVIEDPATGQALILSVVVFLGPWICAVAGLARVRAAPPDATGSTWSLGAIARANAAFGASFLVVAGLAFAVIYGSLERVVVALQEVFVNGPVGINAVDSRPLQPLLLWPTVAIALLIVLSPFVIGAVKGRPLRLAVFAAACAGCAFTALEYSDLQFTVIGTLVAIAFAAIFLWRSPADRSSWQRFFLFLAGTCLLAYLVPHPKYTYSLGLLVVSGWFMLGDLAPRAWPAAMNVLGIAILSVIAALTLRWASMEAAFISPYTLGTHTVRSYDSTFPAAVAAANESSRADWLEDRHDYLVYLAHLP